MAQQLLSPWFHGRQTQLLNYSEVCVVAVASLWAGGAGFPAGTRQQAPARPVLLDVEAGRKRLRFRYTRQQSVVCRWTPLAGKAGARGVPPPELRLPGNSWQAQEARHTPTAPSRMREAQVCGTSGIHAPPAMAGDLQARKAWPTCISIEGKQEERGRRHPFLLLVAW